jgi:hypothetical protein
MPLPSPGTITKQEPNVVIGALHGQRPDIQQGWGAAANNVD